MGRRLIRLTTTIIFVLILPGCKWVDDFRARMQPEYLEQTPRPTLNKESEDYKGNDTDKTEKEEKAIRMPDIDGLSEIPEVPDYPGGVNID